MQLSKVISKKYVTYTHGDTEVMFSLILIKKEKVKKKWFENCLFSMDTQFMKGFSFVLIFFLHIDVLAA